MITYQSILKEFANKDERLVVLTAENRALIRDLPVSLGNRFVDVGIAEQTMIGMAAGLALRGRIPVCHALTSFLIFRAYEFIRNCVAIPALPVKLCGYIPGFLSDANGPTHQALEDISMMRTLPNMEVFCPADAEELALMLPYILESGKPAYVRINHKSSSIDHSPFLPGKAEVYSLGRDVNILVTGMLLNEVLKTQKMLESQGVSTGVINMRSLKPIDEDIIIKAVSTKSFLIIVEDHFRTGGLFSAVAEILAKNGLRTRIISFAMEDKWFTPALLPDVLNHEGFTAEAMYHKIYSTINQLIYVKFN